MVIVVSVLVIVAIVAIIWAVFELIRKTVCWLSREVDAGQRLTPSSTTVPPFGSLPPLGPVGPLGGLAPDADIGSDGTDEHQLYGQ